MTAASISLWTLLGVLGAPAVGASLYVLTATLLSARAPVPVNSRRTLRFDVIVPAHNEAALIARTLASLGRLDWPAGGFRLIVVADNCTDATAAIAGANGAHVIERCDEARRGKGHALSHAFEQSHRDQWADAVVVIDADSEVSPNLLSAMAVRLQNGAHAVQGHYGVQNPHAAWRTRLMAIALGAFHIVRSRARERLRLSSGVRGNGWCVTHQLLQVLPYRAFSLTEDIEYGIDLGMRGYRVHYADEAHVYGEMVTSAASAGKQRQRWEQGRFKLIRERTLPLLRAAVAQPSRICLDLALDLLVLPLSYVALNIAALALIAGLAGLVYPQMIAGLWVAAACSLCLLSYVLRGWQLSGIGWRGLPDLLWAPVYVAWKLVLVLTGGRAREWLRTERERQ